MHRTCCAGTMMRHQQSLHNLYSWSIRWSSHCNTSHPLHSQLHLLPNYVDYKPMNKAVWYYLNGQLSMLSSVEMKKPMSSRESNEQRQIIALASCILLLSLFTLLIRNLSLSPFCPKISQEHSADLYSCQACRQQDNLWRTPIKLNQKASQQLLILNFLEMQP